jgi:hypothetical protein
MCPEIFRKFPGKLRRILKKKIRNFSGKTLENRYIFLKKISPKKTGKFRSFSGAGGLQNAPDRTTWSLLVPGILPPSVPTQGSLMLGMDESGHFTAPDSSFRRAELHKFPGKRSE